MTAPERFAEKSDSLLQRGRRPYMTHERHWATQQVSIHPWRGRSTAGLSHWRPLSNSFDHIIRQVKRARLEMLGDAQLALPTDRLIVKD